MIEATQIGSGRPQRWRPYGPLSVRNIEVVLRQRHPGAAWPQPRCAPRFDRGRCSAPTCRQIDDAEGDLGLLKTEDGEVTRGEILFDGERINGLDPDKIVRRGIFQVDGGPAAIIADMTSIENLRLGAFHPQ